jgi:hypothetical protein
MSDHNLRNISQLSNHRFFIPAFQRGFRWTTLEATALLEDIANFDRDKESFYCLQPLVIKEDGNRWIVVDGQQRLTTLFLILQAIGHEKSFKLKYETRESSWEFLCAPDKDKAKSNIDYHFIFEVHLCVTEWLSADAERTAKFKLNLLHHTKVIWHELASTDDAVAAFTRLNVGKIRLTDAELVRALFLRSNGGEQGQADDLQQQIALEWDQMEKALQADEMWYFLQGDKPIRDCRIQLVLSLVAKSNDVEHETYIHFNDRLKNTPALEVWREVKRMFRILEEWYLDREMFHLIGYLRAAGEKLATLVSRYGSGDSGKRVFKADLCESMQKKLLKESGMGEFLDVLKYGNPSIRQVLLLFNIATMLQHKESAFRFSFFRYHQERWDIEHIHSVASPKGEDKQDPETDSIGNLTLLDRETNRSYKNAPFPDKRKRILGLDCEGKFLPTCTRNVFLKAYSKNPENLLLWTDADAVEHEETMLRVLSGFFKSNCATHS